LVAGKSLGRRHFHPFCWSCSFLIVAACKCGMRGRDIKKGRCWLVLVAGRSSIDYQDHEFPSLCAAWEERGRCHITLQQQDNSQSGSRLHQNRVISFGFKFVWLSEDTGCQLPTATSSFLLREGALVWDDYHSSAGH
jgi:hypothetical protein